MLRLPYPQPSPAIPTCRDPFDLPFLHLAMTGKAVALISGDQDLLVLAGRMRFAIMTPAGYLDTL